MKNSVRSGRALAAIVFLLSAGIAGSMGAAPAVASGPTVNVYYAASLKALNETLVGPGFSDKTGYSYAGFPENSGLIVNQLKADSIHPDVVEFADASLNNQLMGAANGNIVKWYVTFARTHLVIGFYPKGPHSALFYKAVAGKVPWYKPLLQSGLKFGRTDPNSDPKGYRTLFAFNLAQKLYHLKGFSQKVLGTIYNPDPKALNSASPEVFPEATLVSQVTTGNLDAGIFYLPEARAAHLPYLQLPTKINFGLTKYTKLDATQKYTNSQGLVIKGSPVVYTLSIPSTVQDYAGAAAFARFAVSRQATAMGSDIGLQSVKPKVYGDKKAAPTGL